MNSSLSKLANKASPKLHPRNLHNGCYDFSALLQVCPELKGHLVKKADAQLTINFSVPQAVRLLNQALLALYYQIEFWQIPEGYLCPPIPGRADYIHYLADLLSDSYQKETVTGRKIKGLDIGCGANCIYPILGSRLYQWSFVASDIDKLAVQTAKLIVSANQNISKQITVRLQNNPEHFFNGILKSKERLSFTMCNPPFHASMDKANQGSLQKNKNLAKKAQLKNASTVNGQVALNFAGQSHELSCAGGELAFVKKMMLESQQVSDRVCWFTCLISKGDNINPLKKQLKQLNVKQVKVVKMAQGNKISRFIAWSFLDKQQQLTFLK